MVRVNRFELRPGGGGPLVGAEIDAQERGVGIDGFGEADARIDIFSPVDGKGDYGWSAIGNKY